MHCRCRHYQHILTTTNDEKHSQNSFPWPEDYDDGNLLFKRRAPPRRGRPPTRAAAAAHDALAGSLFGAGDGAASGGRRAPTGARLKIMRCLQLKAPDGRRNVFDLGLGVALDLDCQVGACGGIWGGEHCMCRFAAAATPPLPASRGTCAAALPRALSTKTTPKTTHKQHTNNTTTQTLHGVARLKLTDIVSLKLAPAPTLKLSATYPLGNSTGMRLRFRCAARACAALRPRPTLLRRGLSLPLSVLPPRRTPGRLALVRSAFFAPS